MYFDAEVVNQGAIHSIQNVDSFLQEDPAMVLICWPRSQDELDQIKGFQCDEKHMIIDEVNKKLFCSGSNFENRNELSDDHLRNFKVFLNLSFRNKSL